MTVAAGGRHEDDGPRRFLIATAVSRHSKCAAWDRPGLVEARERVVQLFTGQLGYGHESGLGLDPTRDQLTSQVRAFCKSPDRRPDDLLALYIAGHGTVLDDSGDHVLLTSDTDPGDIEDALPTVELARKMLHGTGIRRVLLLLDTCYSGQGGNELAAAALARISAQWRHTQGAGFVVVSSAQPHEEAKSGAFPQLLEQAVGSLATAGHSPSTLPVSAVVQQMNDNPRRPGHQRIGLTQIGLTGEPPAFFANPRHDTRLTGVDLSIQRASEWDEIAQRRETEFTTRLLVRAMGYSGPKARGWWFSGRHSALRALSDWLHHRPDTPGPPVAVVTAGPGSGKTAVLGLVSALTHPERYRTVPTAGIGLPQNYLPSPGSVDVTIYAQGLTDTEVLQGMAAAAETTATTVGEFLEALSGTGDDGQRTRPFTVLIDALDEATTPDSLCSRLLRPLIDHAEGRIRLLLGTRPYLLHHLGLTLERPNDITLERRGLVVDLDNDQYADRDALRAYTVRNLLEAHPGSPYRTAPDALRPVAEAVVEAATPSFLVARITAGTLAAAKTVVENPHDRHWRGSLPKLPSEAMRRDLTRRLGDDATRATDLLRPLAFAAGQGLPWEDIWAPLASAISGRAYSDEDLLWLRRTAGSYVVEATESDRSAYRLYHQALAEHLREDTDYKAVHTAFVATLLARIPYRIDGTRDWSLAHPYALHHLASHAVAAGLIDTLSEDAEFLVHADPDALLRALDHMTSGQGHLARSIYRTSTVHHRRVDYSTRRQFLALDAARWQHKSLNQALISGDATAFPLSLAPRWATGALTSPMLQHTFACRKSGVAFTELRGRPVIVFRGDDHTVQVRDLKDASCVRAFADTDGRMMGMEAAVLDGRPVVCLGGGDGTVQVWHLDDGTRRFALTGHRNGVNDIAFGVVEGRPALVSAGDDATVRLWDLDDGTCLHTMTGHEGTVHAVAFGEIDGQPVAVSGGKDATVRIWDLSSGQCRQTLTGHPSSVFAVAVDDIGGRTVAVAGGYESDVRVWDLADEACIRTMDTHDSVTAVAIADINGQKAIVLGESNGTLRIMDPAEGTCLYRLNGHDNEVSAIAVGQVDGLPVIVTSTEDSTVRVWDLANASPSEALIGHDYWVADIAISLNVGGPLAISASENLRVWDLAEGTCKNVLTAPSASEIRYVASATWNNRPIVVSTHPDSLCVWDSESGTLLRSISQASLGRLACGEVAGRPLAVTASFPDGSIVHTWDLTDGTCLASHSVRDGHGLSSFVAVGVDRTGGKTLAISKAKDYSLRVWDTISEETLYMIPRYADSMEVVLGTVNQRLTAIVGNSYWDLTNGECLARFETRMMSNASAKALGQIDGVPFLVQQWFEEHADSVRFWNVAERQWAGPPLMFPSAISALALSEAGLVVGFDREVAFFSSDELHSRWLAGYAPSRALGRADL